MVRDGQAQCLQSLVPFETALGRCAYACIVDKVRKNFGWTLDIVRRSVKAKGFEVLPHRWIVERTFGWLGRYRHLSRDFEHTVSSSESVVYIASIRRMLKLATN